MPIQPGQALGQARGQRAQIGAEIMRGVFGVQRARGGVELPQYFRAVRKPGLQFQVGGFIAAVQIAHKRPGARVRLGLQRAARLEPRVFVLHRAQPIGEALLLVQAQISGRDEIRRR